MSCPPWSVDGHGLIWHVGQAAMLITLLLGGCGDRRNDPAPEHVPIPSESAAPRESATASPAIAPRSTPDPGAYDVPEEVIRRQTYLSGAVLLQLDAVGALFRESGIRFGRLTRQETFGQYACGDVSADGARPKAALAARELSRHSPELLRRSGVRWVVLCSHLTQGGRPRNAVPASTAGTLLLDATGFETEDYFRETLHHELFHMLDAANQGLLARREWLAQSPGGSSAGHGGAASRHLSGALGSGASSFVSAYAQSAVEEDQAEVFRFLATSPESLVTLAAQDAGVAAKRELMLSRLDAFCDGYANRLICREQ